MENIEVEVRSFISEDKYRKLIKFFKENAEFLNKDDQITYYFNTEQDLRIQKNSFGSKIWLKKGEIHDKHREEIEIMFKKKDFELLEKLFLVLGFNIDIKWFRRRYSFKWQGINVMLDCTKGYGYIIELEKIGNENNKEEIYEFLINKLKEINVKLTPKKEFDEKFKYYKENWRNLVKE